MYLKQHTYQQYSNCKSVWCDTFLELQFCSKLSAQTPSCTRRLLMNAFVIAMCCGWRQPALNSHSNLCTALCKRTSIYTNRLLTQPGSHSKYAQSERHIRQPIWVICLNVFAQLQKQAFRTCFAYCGVPFESMAISTCRRNDLVRSFWALPTMHKYAKTVGMIQTVLVQP